MSSDKQDFDVAAMCRIAQQWADAQECYLLAEGESARAAKALQDAAAVKRSMESSLASAVNNWDRRRLVRTSKGFVLIEHNETRNTPRIEMMQAIEPASRIDEGEIQ